MTRITSLFAMLGLALPLAAQEANSADIVDPPDIILDGTMADLDEYLWRSRPVVVFADAPQDPRFEQQMAFLIAQIDDLRDRDVVVLTDTDPAAESALRRKLRPRGFMLALIGKDGGVKLRKPLPWDVRELSRVIDKMPMRQQEVRDRRGSGS